MASMDSQHCENGLVAVGKPLSEEISIEVAEKEFRKIWEEMVEKPEMGLFRAQLGALGDAWRRWRDIEHNQRKKLQEVRTKMVVSRARTLATASRAKEHQATIASLKKELEKAWKMVDEEHDKQRHLQDNIEKLEMQVENLLRVNERSAGIEITQELITELKSANVDLTTGRDNLQAQLIDLQEANFTKDRLLEELRRDKAAALSSLLESNDQIANVKSVALRETHARELAESDCKKARTEYENLRLQLDSAHKELSEAQQQVQYFQSHCTYLQASVEKLQEEAELGASQCQKLKQECKARIQRIGKLTSELEEKNNYLKVRTEEVERLTGERIRFAKTKDSLLNQIKLLQDKKVDLETCIENLQARLMCLDKEAANSNKLMEEERKKVDSLLRHRDALNKEAAKSCRQRQEMASSTVVLENRCSSMTEQISALKAQLTRCQTDVSNHQRDKQRLQAENCQLKSKVSAASEEMKTLQISISDLRKKMTEAQRQLEQRKVVCESLEADRNQMAKSFSETRDESNELRRKLKNALHQTERLKEECNCKDAALLRSEQEHRRLEKELQALSQEVLFSKQSVSEAQNLARENESRHCKVLLEVGELKEQLRRQRVEFDNLLHERRNLENRLAQRTDELQRLQSELLDTRSSLDKNKLCYTKHMDDIRILKLEVWRLRNEREILKKSMATAGELRVEVFRSHKALLQEKVKNKALEEEMEHPINVHRWRELKGKDPTALELLQKVQVLQKKVILQNEGLAAKMFSHVEDKEQLPKKPEDSQLNQRQGSAKVTVSGSGGRRAKEQALLIKSLQSQLEAFEEEAQQQRQQIDMLKAQLESKQRNLHFQPIRLPHRSAISANPLGSQFRMIHHGKLQ